MTKTTDRRTALPVMLPGATSFSDDRDELSPVQVVRLLKQRPEILNELVAATTIVHEGRRQRTPGVWALAYVAFACSKMTDLEPWWSHTKDTTLWEECGFALRPPYNTVYDRFTELEEFERAFREAAWKLVRRARKHTGGLVGRDIHIDCTEAESHARLIHDCPKGECPNHSDKRGPAQKPDRQNTETVTEIRQAAAKLPPPADMDELVLGDANEYHVCIDEKSGREFLRVRSKNGCWYRSRDTSSGMRMYTRSRGAIKYWDGYYNSKSIDHYTGAPIDVFFFNASINEYNAYDLNLDGIRSALDGELPRAIVTDAGYTIERVYEKNTMLGIATVGPFRGGTHQRRALYDTERYDRHGIPRCKHCGREGSFVSFTTSPKPRLIYACSAQCCDAKGRRMSINCSEKWRLLVPLWRNKEAYMALRKSHREYEGVHRYWRQRYRVAGKDFYTRPKRFGIAWQQLRASAALLVEWLTICWREGWLGSPRRNPHLPVRRSAAGEVAQLLSYRAKIGLDVKAAKQTPPKKQKAKKVTGKVLVPATATTASTTTQPPPDGHPPS